MNPMDKYTADKEQTESVPAQEKVAGDGQSATIPAGEVYAQRAAESGSEGNTQNQGFVP